MKRFVKPLPKDDTFAERLTIWAEQHTVAMVFRGHGWNHSHDVLAAIGCKECSSQSNALDLISFQEKHPEEDVFCHFNYEVKNDLEALSSKNPDTIGFPHCFAFVPDVTIALDKDSIAFECWSEDKTESDIERWQEEISSTPLLRVDVKSSSVKQRITQTQYLDDLKQLQAHIQRGDVYQGNYCQEFYWDNAKLKASALFNRGQAEFPNPFSVYYKLNDHHLMSFSPERFLAMEGDRIYSQPMKGTAPRGETREEDDAFRAALSNSEKDRRENVMIVDMVRNDLSHFATKGSVKVPELYRIETYPKVHQMFSTVEARITPNTSKIAALLKAFPMASMTGAPKIRAMKILEALEHRSRGIYSGTVGYIRSNEVADFNVVIRSLVYSEKQRLLSCFAGGGITALSDPNAEWEECLVKVRPLIDLIDSLQSENANQPLPLDDARTLL